eukprot:62823-Hanusia_phi.AAC.1
MCLPSLLATVEKQFEYKVYIGIDEGDKLSHHTQNLKRWSRGNVQVIPCIFSNLSSYTSMVNSIARLAHSSGSMYLVRINDDTQFVTSNWTHIGIAALSNLKPPNIGVVGPTCKQGNTAILTHDMVHRLHFDIFDFYYPGSLANWWSDDWITKLYSDRAIRLKQWEVVHTLTHGTRYVVNYSHQKLLVPALIDAKIKLNFALLKFNRTSGIFQVGLVQQGLASPGPAQDRTAVQYTVPYTSSWRPQAQHGALHGSTCDGHVPYGSSGPPARGLARTYPGFQHSMM